MVIEIVDVPHLNDPVMVAAFEGWNDAAGAATGVVDHLIDVWDAQVVAVVDPEEFYDFQVNRPTVATTDEGMRRITWPSSQVYVARPPGAMRDVVLLRGIEPNMKWRQFCAELLACADELGVRLVVTIGALLAETVHSRPIQVSGSATELDLEDRLKLEPATYEGPTGIVGVLNDACTPAGRPGCLVLGGGAALPAAAAVPQGHAGAARSGRGRARDRDPARRPPRGEPGLGARCGRAGRGGRGRR